MMEIETALLQDEKGRATVFAEMVREMKEPIYFFVRKIVIDHNDADDVTQNTFLKAWRGLPNFRAESKISTWLFSIAYNESIRWINKRNKLAGIPLDQVAYKLEDQLQDDVYFSGDEIQRKLTTALATLPDKQRLVFIMKYQEEKKYEEIATITGTSVGALKASYHHAVQKIKKQLSLAE